MREGRCRTLSTHTRRAVYTTVTLADARDKHERERERGGGENVKYSENVFYVFSFERVRLFADFLFKLCISDYFSVFVFTYTIVIDACTFVTN